MIFDTHCHILPGLDDGAADLEQSMALLRQEVEQGVSAFVCTPHFYPRTDNADERDERVTAAYASLQAAARQENISFFLGHEVHYFPGMAYSSEITRYCYENTHLLLLELPFETDISRDMIRNVTLLGDQVGYEVVLAHLERYSHDPMYKQLVSLVREGVVKAQIAPGLLTSRSERSAIAKLLKHDLVSYIGSDAHDPTSRPVRIGTEWTELSQKFPHAAERIEEESRLLYERMTGNVHADQPDTLFTF